MKVGFYLRNLSAFLLLIFFFAFRIICHSFLRNFLQIYLDLDGIINMHVSGKIRNVITIKVIIV